MRSRATYFSVSIECQRAWIKSRPTSEGTTAPLPDRNLGQKHTFCSSSMFINVPLNCLDCAKVFPLTAGLTFFLLCVFINVHIEFLHIVGLSTSRNPVIAPTFFYITCIIKVKKKKKDTCEHSHTQVVYVSFCNIWAFFVYFFVIFLFVLNWLSPHRSAQRLNILT